MARKPVDVGMFVSADDEGATILSVSGACLVWHTTSCRRQL